MTTHGESQLSAAQHAHYALKAQRAWHWSAYSPAQQRAILERVKALVAARPHSYLARHWREIYQ